MYFNPIPQPTDIYLSLVTDNNLTSDRQMLNMAFVLLCGWGKKKTGIMAPESFLFKFGYIKDEITFETAGLMKIEIDKHYFDYVRK